MEYSGSLVVQGLSVCVGCRVKGTIRPVCVEGNVGWKVVVRSLCVCRGCRVECSGSVVVRSLCMCGGGVGWNVVARL